MGFSAGFTWRNSAGQRVASVVRYAADLLNGVPSIVIGIFAYSLVVLPFKHFSTLAGAFALGLMMIPITLRSTEEFLSGGATVCCAKGPWRWGQANGKLLQQ